MRLTGCARRRGRNPHVGPLRVAQLRTVRVRGDVEQLLEWEHALVEIHLAPDPDEVGVYTKHVVEPLLEGGTLRGLEVNDPAALVPVEPKIVEHPCQFEMVGPADLERISRDLFTFRNRAAHAQASQQGDMLVQENPPLACRRVRAQEKADSVSREPVGSRFNGDDYAIAYGVDRCALSRY